MNVNFNIVNTFHSLNKKEILVKLDETIDGIKKENVKEILSKELRRKCRRKR